MSTHPLSSSVAATPHADAWRAASSMAAHPSRVGDEPLVASIAAGLAAVSVPWELAAGFEPQGRCYELLLATEHYDAWLIHWPVGTGLEAHDHGGSAGAFAVVSGVLDEDTEADRSTITRSVGPGEWVSFDGDHVHAVVNRGIVGATSVHVYSPPLRTMGFHRTDPSGRPVVHRVGDAERWTP